MEVYIIFQLFFKIRYNGIENNLRQTFPRSDDKYSDILANLNEYLQNHRNFTGNNPVNYIQNVN